MAKSILTKEQVHIGRTNLLGFTSLMTPNYLIAWFHRIICAELMMFYLDVKKKLSPRLIIEAPPRHGKSQIGSRAFPAWVEGVDPSINFNITCYGSELSNRMSRDVKRIMNDPRYLEMFPGTNLSLSRKNKTSDTVEFFQIPNHEGSIYTNGINNGVTGMGFDIISIDDPLKGRMAARSKTIRDNIWEVYTSDLYTRLSNGGGVVVTQTRWHEDDLAGRLIKEQEKGGDKFKILSFPAIAEEDCHFRKKGEALHEERYPLERLEKIKLAIGESNFASLYQQRPNPEGGAIFKAVWFQYEDFFNYEMFDFVIQSWDLTFKGDEDCDRSACTVWGMHGNKFYLIDGMANQLSFSQTLDAIQLMRAKHPYTSAIVIEDNANGPAAINILKDRVPGIIPFNVGSRSKIERAKTAAVFYESGSVYHCTKKMFVSDMESEMISFPSGKHDDYVDSNSMALIYMSTKFNIINSWEN